MKRRNTYLLLIILLTLFSCSDDEEILVEGVIEASIDGEFKRFTYSSMDSRQDNFYHLGKYAHVENDRIRLQRCYGEERKHCIELTILNSDLDDQSIPLSVGNGTITFKNETRHFSGSTGSLFNAITITSKSNDVLEGTFNGRLLENGNSLVVVENGRFSIKVFRYEENIMLDTCEAKSGLEAVTHPDQDTPLFNGTVNGEQMEWIGDGCNFRVFRDAGIPNYSVAIANAKEYSPPTKALWITLTGLTSFKQDTILARHEPGFKKIVSPDAQDEGVFVQLFLSAEQFEQTPSSAGIHNIIFSTDGVEQPEDAFEIISRNEIERLDHGFPWFDYQAQLNLRLQEDEGEREIELQGKVYMRVLLAGE